MILIHHYSERIKRKERYFDAFFDANGNNYLWNTNCSLTRTKQKFVSQLMSQIMFSELDFFLYHDNQIRSFLSFSPRLVSYVIEFGSSIMEIAPNGQQDEEWLE